jgi:hypothetical protein
MTQVPDSKAKHSSTNAGENAGENLHPLIDVSPDPVPTKPSDWDGIQVGSLVLAWDREVEGWFEALITNEVAGVFRLKWRDYPEIRPITRKRQELALLHPDETAPNAA